MKILLAPDSFKGTLSAEQVIRYLEEGIESTSVNAAIIRQPLSDGGEGFVKACCFQKGHLHTLRVAGPLLDEVEAVYGINGSAAVIELASAAGIELLDDSRLDPLNASTFGLGQLIDHVSGLPQINTLYAGLGGSATHDCGLGMLRALGVRFLGPGKEITKFREVENIESIDLNKIAYISSSHNIICAADVTNPLLGEHGAAQVYARQKGATEADILQLEQWSRMFADKVEDKLGKTFRHIEGTGAAGGTGYAFCAFLGASMMPGFRVLCDWTGLEAMVKEADLVVTGEGRLDRQSSFGKAPVALLRLCRSYGKPVVGVFGSVDSGGDDFDNVLSLAEIAGSARSAMENAPQWVRKAGEKIVHLATSR